MRFVIDTNILLSALIRDATTRKVLVESNWSFYYPEISFHEIRKYKDLVLEKSGVTEDQYNQILAHLLTHITIVPDESMKVHLKEASEILGKIDPDDVVFLSTAMGIDNAKIWSDDKHFEKQERVTLLKSQEIVKIFFDKKKE